MERVKSLAGFIVAVEKSHLTDMYREVGSLKNFDEVLKLAFPRSCLDGGKELRGCCLLEGAASQSEIVEALQIAMADNEVHDLTWKSVHNSKQTNVHV